MNLPCFLRVKDYQKKLVIMRTRRFAYKKTETFIKTKSAPTSFQGSLFFRPRRETLRTSLSQLKPHFHQKVRSLSTHCKMGYSEVIFGFSLTLLTREA